VFRRRVAVCRAVARRLSARAVSGTRFRFFVSFRFVSCRFIDVADVLCSVGPCVQIAYAYMQRRARRYFLHKDLKHFVSNVYDGKWSVR
jgi:hypothetical protein